MDYWTPMRKVIDYIEENLCYELEIDVLAKVAGYSKYHFIRVFCYITGMTPAEYIRKRRITEIVKEMSETDENISNIAFRYGFNSKENFTRAFKQEHKVLPSEYRLIDNSLYLCEKIHLEKKSLSLEPQIIKMDEINLVTFKSDEEDMTKFWNKYNCNQISREMAGGKTVEDFGVSVWNDEEQRVDYYIGIEAGNVKKNLEGTVNIHLSAKQYAVFDTPPGNKFNFVEMIKTTWNYVFNEWIPNSRYEYTGGPDFETYIEDSKCYLEKIYITIKEKENHNERNN